MQRCAETVHSLICFCYLTVVQTSLAPQDLNLVIQLLLVAHHQEVSLHGVKPQSAAMHPFGDLLNTKLYSTPLLYIVIQRRVGSNPSLFHA